MWLSFLSLWCLQVSISQMWSWCSPTVFSIILVTLMRQRPDIDCSGSSTLSWADLAYWSTALPCPPNAPDTEADALLSPSPPSRDWKEETDVEVAVVLFPKVSKYISNLCAPLSKGITGGKGQQTLRRTIKLMLKRVKVPLLKWAFFHCFLHETVLGALPFSCVVRLKASLSKLNTLQLLWVHGKIVS